MPLFPPIPPSPSLSPSGSGSILPSPLEERKRPGLLHLLLQGKGGGGARDAPLLRVVVVAAPPFPLVPLLLPLLLPLLPPSTPSAQMCVLLCVFFHRLIVVFVWFRPSPTRVPRCARCSLPAALAQQEGAVRDPRSLRRRSLAHGVSAAAEAAASRPSGAPPAFSRIGACPAVLPPASARRGVGDAPARPQRGCGAALPPAFRGAAAARRTRSSRAARSPASGAFAATAVRSPVDQSGLRRRDSATATTTVATTATTRRRHFPRLSRGATTATARLHSFRTYGDAAAGRRVAMSAAAGSRATRDDDARHNTAGHASGRRPRRPVPRRHTAIAPSRDSHDDRDAAAGAGVVVGGGGVRCGVRVRTTCGSFWGPQNSIIP